MWSSKGLLPFGFECKNPSLPVLGKMLQILVNYLYGLHTSPWRLEANNFLQ